ncbi:ABC transporter permease [Candidatus Aerophobetes bacterium Ae_b3a]|nr:MAG: ABC transporter permease [Candidatus Aerophobetes bacterium Ae_b3a]
MQKKQIGILLCLPSFIIIFFVLGYPLGYSIYISFLKMNIASSLRGPEFVGLTNYVNALYDIKLWAAIGRTAYITVWDVLVGTSLGLLMALLLNTMLKGRGILRAIVLFPFILPPVVNGLIWKWVYNPNYGFLNGFLYQIGIIRNYQSWLSQPWTALHMIILANLWQGTAFAYILYLGGLQSIPLQLYDAAKIDGASRYQTLIRITLPLLLPITLVIVVLKTILTFKLFDLIYVLTGGGPANSTQVITYYIYKKSFDFLEFGGAAALSYILTLLLLVFVYVYYKLLQKDVY